MDDRRLFRGMGFHTGSGCWPTRVHAHRPPPRSRRADMVQALEATKIELQGQKHDAYYWIRIHTGVEAELRRRPGEPARRSATTRGPTTWRP
jgi:hypothetical protein